ncbi:P-loop ATPase, Sll1717 family [Sediminibacillus terrae]|uniref:P-loop ATPase, Sll1717 family n=1 Tax=Sediminibacillus terrae TaxID=1562106 RepID=UPI001296204D|nr:hypothetical protein [Sediminibacillus terrae]
MEIKLQLSDLYLGNIDAKHELLSNTEDERIRFKDSFFMPENIILNDYFDGRKFFVTGLKGTGKTALLRYMAINVENELNAQTSFVLFKSDIKEQDRKDFSKAARTVVANNNSEKMDTTDNDYEDVWRWFIHRQIVEVIESRNLTIFENDKNWKRYSTCIKAPKLGDEESGIKKLFPKLKRGNVELNAGLDGVSGTLGLEFDWEDNNQTKVSFSSLVKQADNLFERLVSSNEKLFIFLDELELTLGVTKQYIRDKKLIRDLIIAINDFNIKCRKKRYNIYIISAIRSEVLTAVESSGKEINKIISDFGTPIVWHQSGGNISNHPILQIILKRILASEKIHDLNLDDSYEAIWNRYFPTKIQNEETPRYILHLTWYRPRDVIRLLNLAQKQHPKATKFTHQVFDDVRKHYSTESWVELSEELRAIYNEREISGIKRMIYGIKNPFTFNNIRKHAESIREMYSEVDVLLERHKIGEILSYAYRVGLLGNTGEKVRFAHRGDDEILLEKTIMIHRALWASLSIEHNTQKLQKTRG